MITISPYYNKYRMTFSNPLTRTRGLTVIVKDLEQVHVCINHYYFRPHDKANCPLCENK